MTLIITTSLYKREDREKEVKERKIKKDERSGRERERERFDMCVCCFTIIFC
jgi:hypothetical protein